MKTTIERSTLLNVLSHAQPIVERRNTIPILSNVLLEAEDETLHVTATDLDMLTNEPVAATVEKPGKVTVPAHTLFDIIRKVPEGPVALTAESGRLTVVAGRSRFSLPTLPAEEFPHISTGDMPISFSIPASVLSDMIRATRHAISTEETRYYLQGIFLHARGNPNDGWRLAATSTDGHRLALATTEDPEGASALHDIAKGVIVPRKCVLEIARMVDQVDGDVQIAMSASKIRFELGRMTYVSKLIDGTFPDYQRIIPSDNDSIVLVDAEELAKGIDRVSTIATEKTRAVKVSVEHNRLILSVNSPDNGLATEEIEIEYRGKPIEIGFNSRYFLDALNLIKGGRVELAMKDSAAPVVMRKEGDAHNIGIIMPMRV